MKNKLSLAGFLFTFLILLSSCEHDYQIILSRTFEDLIIEDKVSRIVYIENKREVEVYTKVEAGGNLFVLKNQEKEYFLDKYQRLLEEEEITNPQGLEFDVKYDPSDFIEAYGFLFLLLSTLVFTVIYIIRQNSTIRILRDRVHELEDELKYTR